MDFTIAGLFGGLWFFYWPFFQLGPPRLGVYDAPSAHFRASDARGKLIFFFLKLLSVIISFSTNSFITVKKC